MPIEPTDADIGHRVQHRNPVTKAEEFGEIASIREDYVFVWIESFSPRNQTGGGTPRACRREDLDWVSAV